MSIHPMAQLFDLTDVLDFRKESRRRHEELQRDPQQQTAELATRLRTVTMDIRGLRQTFEASLNEAQRAAYRELEAKSILKDHLAIELETSMRALVNHRG